MQVQCYSPTAWHMCTPIPIMNRPSSHAEYQHASSNEHIYQSNERHAHRYASEEYLADDGGADLFDFLEGQGEE